MLPTITLEEHYLDPAVIAASDATETYARFPPALRTRLEDLSDSRISSLKSNSISLQVLSHTPVSATSSVCRSANDALHAAILQHPTHYRAFALLPMSDPAAAAAELARCVRELGFVGALVDNHCEGTFYDAAAYDVLWAAAQEHDVPVYLHPTFPTGEELARTYASPAYADEMAAVLGAWGWGWHVSTGLHFLRLYAAGVFDRFPKLKIVLGHMGELLPFQIDRIIGVMARSAGPTRGLRDVWEENVWITTSGMFSLAPMACLLRAFPVDKLMFSVDYPFSGNELGRKFLDELEGSGLVDRAQLEGIAFRNAERLLRVSVEGKGADGEGK